METQFDLFGEVVKEKTLLRDSFIEPPFTVLDARQGDWQMRKNKWRSLGIKSEIGRDAVSIHIGTSYGEGKSNSMSEYTSIFDPHLCELIYKWFCPDGGRILDPFCGGSVRGIVAAYSGYDYTGIDIREEQIQSNEEQAKDILDDDDQKKIRYICGDSDRVLDTLNATAGEGYDLVFSCPPYADLEVYSNLPGDISNMSYDNFLTTYRSIISKSCDKLNSGGFACFVVGEVRDPKDRDGAYYSFVPDTVRAFTDCGMLYYNEAILLTPVGSGSMRAMGNMKSKKLVKTHQNILVFKKK